MHYNVTGLLSLGGNPFKFCDWGESPVPFLACLQGLTLPPPQLDWLETRCSLICPAEGARPCFWAVRKQHRLFCPGKPKKSTIASFRHFFFPFQSNWILCSTIKGIQQELYSRERPRTVFDWSATAWNTISRTGPSGASWIWQRSSFKRKISQGHWCYCPKLFLWWGFLNKRKCKTGYKLCPKHVWQLVDTDLNITGDGHYCSLAYRVARTWLVWSS